MILVSSDNSALWFSASFANPFMCSRLFSLVWARVFSSSDSLGVALIVFGLGPIKLRMTGRTTRPEKSNVTRSVDFNFFKY